LKRSNTVENNKPDMSLFAAHLQLKLHQEKSRLIDSLPVCESRERPPTYHTLFLKKGKESDRVSIKKLAYRGMIAPTVFN
jgi:hypothetical protein